MLKKAKKRHLAKRHLAIDSKLLSILFADDTTLYESTRDFKNGIEKRVGNVLTGLTMRFPMSSPMIFPMRLTSVVCYQPLINPT
jgi:hypothetical protein